MKITNNVEIEQFLENCENPVNKKKFGILSVDEREIVKNVFDGLYVGNLRKEKQIWQVYNIWEGHFPQDINSF